MQAERAALDDRQGASRLEPMTPTASISTLRQKLQDKIDSLRKGRKAVPEETVSRLESPSANGNKEVLVRDGASDDGSLTDGDNDTLASRDEMLEARRKKRGEVRDNRRRRRKEERRGGKETSEKQKPELKPGDKSKPADFTSRPGKVSAWTSRTEMVASNIWLILLSYCFSNYRMVPDKSAGAKCRYVGSVRVYRDDTRVQRFISFSIFAICWRYTVAHAIEVDLKPYSSFGAFECPKIEAGRHAR